MPYYRKKRSSYRRRTSRRKAVAPYRKRKPRYTRYRRPILEGFPKRKIVKLRYSQTLVYDIGAGSFGSLAMRANGAFDPYAETGGHQPMGYDQWAAIYSRYTVIGTQIRLTYINTSVAQPEPGLFGILLSTNSASVNSQFSNINAMLESKLVGDNYKVTSDYSVSGNRHSALMVKKGFSAKKFFGKNNVNDGTGYSGLVSGLPAQQAYFHCWVSSFNGNNPGILSFQAVLDYIIMFQEPVVLDGS